MKIAFLHTLDANIKLFNPYIEAYLPGILVHHYVDESLLKNAMSHGVESVREDVSQAVKKLIENGFNTIICSCSTIGALAEEVNVSSDICVLRVDRPMAEATVGYSKVLILAAVESTFEPSIHLLQQVNKAMDLVIDTELVEGAWAYYAAGNTEGYIKSIKDYLMALPPRFSNEYDVILLAQASMAPALSDIKKESRLPIYSSPELCLQYLQA